MLFSLRCGCTASIKSILLLSCFLLSSAHVALDYPPPIFKLDFLDNFRTKALCGMEASGADRSDLWRLPSETPVITDLEANSTLNTTWNLHYPHQGGWRFDLYDEAGKEVASWAAEDHWGCNYDGTQQFAQLALPVESCTNCILRLQRQALEWGASYRFRSCARVNIVPSKPCNGCSGHGRCVEGTCVCDNDMNRGFWEGTYCERQNECGVNADCGTGGLCIDTKATTPPRKQCYCKTGWFGKELQPWLPMSPLGVRRCNEKSSLRIDDIAKWKDIYALSQESTPSGAFALFYKIEEDKGLVEYAIKAKTKSWVGLGLRPVSSSSGSIADSLLKISEAESEGEPVSESEAEAESETTSHSESISVGSCETGANFYLFDQGEFYNDSTPSSSTRKLSEISFPALEAEAVLLEEKTGYDGWSFRGLKEESGYGESEAISEGHSSSEGESEVEPEPHAEGESEVEPEPHAEGESEVEPEPHAEGESEVEPKPYAESESESETVSESESASQQRTKSKVSYFGTEECRSLLTSDPKAHPMINQDIVIGLAKENSFKIQDSFTPSRARPLPDYYFGGTDDILDAIGYEDEDHTYMKLRKPLKTLDSFGDYCLLRGVEYLMIYAFGQSPDFYYHSPSSSLEAQKAGNTNFYGVDELKFHGGGIGTSHESRGIFGLKNFFEVTEPNGCLRSTLPEYTCMEEVIAGVQLHWRVGESFISFAVEAPGNGWVSLAWPEQPGSMVPSDAVIGSNADVGVYRLSGKQVDKIIPDSSLFPVSNVQSTTSSGRTLLQFDREFDRSFSGKGDTPLLVAYNPDAGDLSYHGFSNRAAISVNFETGVSQSDAVESVNEVFYDTHALLMVISWGVLIPLGVVVARTLKDKDPLWFKLHRFLQVLGLLGAIAGFVIAFLKFDTPDDFRHRQVGLVTMVLGVFQPLNAALRPKHGALLRGPWEWLHISVGRCAVILAMYNIYTGLDAYETLRVVGSKKWQFRFGMWLIALVLLYLLLEARAQGIRSSQNNTQQGRKPQQGSSLPVSEKAREGAV